MSEEELIGIIKEDIGTRLSFDPIIYSPMLDGTCHNILRTLHGVLNKRRTPICSLKTAKKAIFLASLDNIKYHLWESFENLPDPLSNTLPTLLEEHLSLDNPEVAEQLSTWMIQVCRRCRQPGSPINHVPIFIGPTAYKFVFTSIPSHLLGLAQFVKDKDYAFSRSREQVVSVITPTDILLISSKIQEDIKNSLFDTRYNIYSEFLDKTINLPRNFSIVGHVSNNLGVPVLLHSYLLMIPVKEQEEGDGKGTFFIESKRMWKLAWQLSVI